MSKINAIRLINLNYNHNGIRVDDEVLYLNGESTLLSLRNGGGKSVLVQMLIAPFVHKRYRDANRRKFSSYFTTNKPTFILVEWQLDNNMGYVLTGMMVRKSQEIRDDQANDDLDIIQFVHEYRSGNPYDIYNIPFVNTTDDEKKLMKYSDCKKLLDSLKVDRDYNFISYDMNNYTQSKSYFEKIKEYQIYYKEWESIVKKINLKESGLSELFLNTKDEKGLIESWFLPAVEDKLNKTKNRIDEFRDILGRYIKQYKDNKSKIDQKNVIVLFKEETIEVIKVAERLKTLTKEKVQMENKIANLIVRIKALKVESESQKSSLDEKLIELDDEIRIIQYEEISYNIYKLEDKVKDLQGQLDQLSESIKFKEIQQGGLIKKRDTLKCAKINESYREASRDVQELENKIEFVNKEEKDKAPERENLGFTLKAYYEKELNSIKSKIDNLQNDLRVIEGKAAESELALEALRKEEISKSIDLSRLDQKIVNYDSLENNFNDQYKEDIKRNLLGEYEEGFLEIKINDLKTIIDQLSRNIIRDKITKNNNEEKLKANQRLIQYKAEEKARISEKTKFVGEKLKELDSKIEKRKTILKYIGFNEDKIFDTEGILAEFKRKSEEVQKSISSYEIKIKDLEDQYNKLKTGKVLQLPEDIKEAMGNEGINYIYGMEWLKKNNKSPLENKEMVKNNPFIPYSLILTLGDLKRLKEFNLNLYTSFPIPIVIRENLEKPFTKESTSIYSIDRVSFYVLFNQNLLDEKMLADILNEKEEEIQNLRSLMEIRKEDKSQYDDRYNIINYQGLNQKDYNNTKDSLKSIIELEEALEKELNNLLEDRGGLIHLQEETIEAIEKNGKQLEELSKKHSDLYKLRDNYIKYLDSKKTRIKTQEVLKKVKEKIKNLKVENIRLTTLRDGAKESWMENISKEKEIQDLLGEYLRYTKGEIIERDIEDIVARYKALTSKITNELNFLEDSLKKANGRFKEVEKDLLTTSKRLNIMEEEFIGETYDDFVFEKLEEDINIISRNIRELNEGASNLKTKIAVKLSKIEGEYDKLKEKVNKDKPLLRKQIVFTEFKKRIMEKNNQLKTSKSLLGQIIERINNYESNLSALAEYEDFKVMEEIEFGDDMVSYNKVSLDRFRGRMIRDYRNQKETINNYSNELSASIDELLRIKMFQEDFIKRPLNTLYSLIKFPDDFLDQLRTTIKAYDDLMAKLEVDIAIVEREKQKIIEILLEYIRDIHKNLDEIDKNSNIRIRERYIRMLKIELPIWEEEEYSFKNKLTDMVEILTQSGIQRLENNENVEEVIGPIITTRNLYNTVVGINRIDIKLYKIEAERQYQIKWAEVSKNSGGEGFLSAFVVLSSLLSFMRRDETDIFRESEEGKVLLMDNPFAQTYSSHLLDPLIDIANKSNTQLISFTGLGGESIYSSFDNIYVLNLIPSKLIKGMHFLKSHKAKGEEIEIMTSTQIKTEEMEQLDLFFWEE